MATKNYKPSISRKLASLDLKSGHVISAEEFNSYVRILATQANQIDSFVARIYSILGGEVPEGVYDFSGDENKFELPEGMTSIIDGLSQSSVVVSKHAPVSPKTVLWIEIEED